ncbi:tripartite motif-containing protein 2-like [Ptychodera flava]|uniref:tripartite motif-containing protein 2-like n=1 Tax=Ptychodera flava TaxID=63121 RepID=UPI003969DB6D
MAAAASSVGDVLGQIGEDFLTCVICFERYRKPKSLPCLHTFCEQCLLTLVENQGVLNCPTCKTSCPLPHGGVRALKSNFFITGLIEDLKARQKEEKKPAEKCNSCQEKDAVPVCIDCTIVDHRIPQHVHRNLNTVADEYLAQLSNILSKMELKNHEVESRHKASKQARSLLQEKDKEAQKQLKNRAESVKQVRRDEEKLRDELWEHYDFQLKYVDTNISEIEMELDMISSTSSYLKKLMSHGNAAQLLLTKIETTRQTERILSSESVRPF